MFVIHYVIEERQTCISVMVTPEGMMLRRPGTLLKPNIAHDFSQNHSHW